MSPTAIVGGTLGLTTLLAAAAAYWQYTAHMDERENRVQWELAATIARQELQSLTDAQELAQDHADELAEVESGIRARIERMINENDRLRAAREADMLARPFRAGTDLYVDLNRIMCRIESAGRDGDPRSCDLSSAEAEAASSPVVIVTPDVAAQWRDLCDATGDRDFCDYAIAGLTAGAMTELRNWMLRIEAYAEHCQATYDYYREVLDRSGAAQRRAGGTDK